MLPPALSPTAAGASPFHAGAEPRCHRRTAQKRQAPLSQDPHPEVSEPSPTATGPHLEVPPQEARCSQCHRRPAIAGAARAPPSPDPFTSSAQAAGTALIDGSWIFLWIFVLDKEYRQRDENNED
jgi:hypothetical protein